MQLFRLLVRTIIASKYFPEALHQGWEPGPRTFDQIGLESERPLAVPARPPSYRPDIDGLRAIAVTAVVLFHAGVFPFSRSGYVGVDIFFVISGYLIGGIILRAARKGRFSIGMFYARRARRILPMLITVVLLTCAAGGFLLGAAQFRSLGGSATAALLAISNVSFWRFNDYFQVDSTLLPLLMTWSLGVEEQFYVLFPLLVFGIARRSDRTVIVTLAAVTLASFVLCAWATYTHPAAAFYLVPFRAWELGVGVVLAFMELTGKGRGSRLLGKPGVQWVASAGLALLGVSIFGFSDVTPFPGFAAVLPVLGTAALLSTEESWVNRNLLSWRPVVFVGLISYSWYLWHWPMMSYVRNVAFDDSPVWVMGLTAALTFLMAILSWRFVEQPFRRGPIQVRRVLLGYASVLALAVALPVAIKQSSGFPGRLSYGARQVEAELSAGLNRPCLAGWEADKPDVSSACVYERTGRPTVVLIGDSHAWALSDGVRAAAARQDWGFEILTKSACRPLLGVTVWRRAEPELAETCAAFMAEAFGRAKSDPNVETVILAGLWPIPDAPAAAERFQSVNSYNESSSRHDLLRAGLSRAVAELVAAGKHVIILGDTPRWRFDVSQVGLTEAMPVRSMLAPWLWSNAPHGFPDRPGLDLIYKPDERNTRLFKLLSEENDVRYIDLFQRFCLDGECMFERDGNLMFIDTGHLSAFGARYALQDLQLN